MSQNIQSGSSMSTLSLLKSIENKHYVYRGKDCMKKFCESLRERAIKIINFKKKKTKLLTKEHRKYIKMNRDLCHYTGEYRGAAHSICNLEHSVPEKKNYSFL